MNTPQYWLVIPAAGIGQRMQAECPKQYLRIQDRFVLDITLSRLLASMAGAGADVSGTMVALHPEDRWWPQTVASGDVRVQCCLGGRERADSVLAALRALQGQAHADDWVLVHDVARPCLAESDLRRLVTTLADHPVGGLLAAPVADTLKLARPGSNEVTRTQDRRNLWRALTPQMFRYGTLVAALEHAAQQGLTVTDEASAMEAMGLEALLVEGRPDNIKITVPADLAMADFILSQLAGVRDDC